MTVKELIKILEKSPEAEVKFLAEYNWERGFGRSSLEGDLKFAEKDNKIYFGCEAVNRELLHLTIVAYSIGGQENSWS